MSSGHILIVEDDEAIATGLALNFKLGGYDATVLHDAENALALLSDGDQPDLLVLDINLPRMNGLALLSALRHAGHILPIIMLSAREDETDKVAALRLGADDYITKPFSLAELMARVAAVLRRSNGVRTTPATGNPSMYAGDTMPPAVYPSETASPAPQVPQPPQAPQPSPSSPPSEPPPPSVVPYSFANIIIDTVTHTVTRAGKPIKLTPLEFDLLCFLVRNPSQVFSREQLLRHVWGQSSGTPRTVDNFVGQLRSKLEQDPESPCHFVTVRGSGYRFDP